MSDQPTQRRTYETLVINNVSGEMIEILTVSTGPEQARADALHECFRRGWRNCRAPQPGRVPE